MTSLPRCARCLYWIVPIALSMTTTTVSANQSFARPLQVGFETTICTAPGEKVQWLYAPALNVAWTVNDKMSVGIQRLTFGSVPLAAGDRFHFGLTPYIEHFKFISSRTQLFGQLGLAWQTRSGADLQRSVGWALSGSAGARRWMHPNVSIGAMVGVMDVLSAGWATSPRVLPGGAIMVSLGFMLEGHF